jgi:hypothetical protein
MVRKSNNKIIYSTYYDEVNDLRADIVKSGNNYVVDLYRKGILINSKLVEGKSLYYAESLAENYTIGITDGI